MRDERAEFADRAGGRGSVPITIGELAERAHVNRETVRYYERRRLLPRPSRSVSGYRTTEWYRESMPKYKAAFEDANIELPRDAEILADHRLLRMERGVARIPERRMKGEEGRQRHGDSAIAGALAYYASQTKPREYGFTPAPPARRRCDEVAPDNDDFRRGRGRGWRGQRLRFGPGAW